MSDQNMPAENSYQESLRLKKSSNTELLAECAREHRPALEEFFTRFDTHIANSIKAALFNNASPYFAYSDPAFYEISSRVIDKLLIKKKLAECRNPLSIRSWLASICTNETIGWLREKSLFKNLPKLPIEFPAGSIHQPLGNTTQATLEDIIPSPARAVDDEPAQERPDISLLEPLKEIADESARWICRLWFTAVIPLTDQEMLALSRFSGVSLLYIQFSMMVVLKELEMKKTIQGHAATVSLRLWHRLRQLETELYDQFYRPGPSRQADLRREREELSARYDAKLRIAGAHIRPSNKEIAFFVGMPESKAGQVSTIFARHSHVFSALL